MNNNSENMTEPDNLYVPMTQQPIWMTSLTLNILLIVVSVWLSVTIAVYGVQSGKFRKRKKSDFNGGLVFKMAFATTGLILPRLVATHIVVWVGFDVGEKGDLDCEIAMDISIGAYYVALLPVYLFLWIRQKFLFEQPSIERLYNKAIKVISWGCLLFLITAGIGAAVLFFLPLAYRSSPRGCILREEEEESVIVFYISTVVLISGQLTLLGLFIYPLYRHTNIQVPVKAPPEETKSYNQDKSTLSTVSTSFNSLADVTAAPCHSTQAAEGYVAKLSPQTNRKSSILSPSPMRQSLSALRRKISVEGLNKIRISSQQDTKRRCKTSKRVLMVMRRSIICAALCLFSDVLALVVSGFLIPRNAPKSITNTVFDVSLTLNVLSLVFSFENYKKMLRAPLMLRKKENRVQMAASTTSAMTNSVNEESKTRQSSMNIA